MQAIAGPGVIAAERFQNYEGLFEFARPRDGVVQRKIPTGAAEGNHPVQDKIFFWPDGLVVTKVDANFRDGGQVAPPKAGPGLETRPRGESSSEA
jgi:hypothetical protein